MNKLKNKWSKTMITLALSLALTACGGSDSETVPDEPPNSAPVISSTGVNTAESGSTYSYTLVSSDADGDSLILSASSLPAWLSFDSSTGILSGTPAEIDAGDHTITLTVSDGTVDVTQSFTITVTVPVSVNNAPTITSTAITSATVGEAYSYTLTATDADNDTLTMSTTIPGELSWSTFDAATGILSGTPASGDIAATEINLTVNDGTDDTTQAFTITVVDAVVNPTPVLVVYDDALNSDIWDVGISNGSVHAVLTDVTLDDGNNVWEFDFKADGENTVTVIESSVENDVSFYHSLKFDIRVLDYGTNTSGFKLKLEGVGQTPEMFAGQPALNTWETIEISMADFTAGGFDASTVKKIVFFPAWGDQQGVVFQIDNMSFAPAPLGANNGPTITSTAITSATVGEAYSYTLTATDADNDTLTMSTTIPDELSWLAFDAATGILSGMPALSDIAATEITLTVNDGTDDTTQAFTITVVDAVVHPTPVLVVYDDALDSDTWDVGISNGSDHAVLTDVTLDDGNKVWEFDYKADGENTVTVIESSVENDVSLYHSLKFDIRVLDYGTNTSGFKLKLEGVGQTPEMFAGQPVLNTWETIEISIADFTAGGFDASTVKKIVLFPAWGDQQGVVFQIDNMRFAPALSVADVFANELDSVWDIGISSGGDHAVLTDVTLDDGNKVWNLDFKADGGNTVIIIESSTANDFSEFTSLQFDLRVLNYGANTSGFKLKLEGAGQTPEMFAGQPDVDTWATIKISMADFTASGFDASTVKKIVFFPAWGDQQGVVFQVDNMKFIKEF